MAARELPSIGALLAETVRLGGSDLHLKVGVSPVIRVHGQLQATDYPMLRAEDTERDLDDLLPERLRVESKQTHEADFAVADATGRGRVNAFRQRGMVSVALRPVPPPGKTFADLGPRSL